MTKTDINHSLYKQDTSTTMGRTRKGTEKLSVIQLRNKLINTLKRQK